MVNKLLIGFGVLTLVAIGSVGAWKLAGADRRVGALGSLERPVPLSWRGEWSEGSRYQPGEVVSYGGASYVAEVATDGQVPSAKEGPWALMAARGLQGTFDGTLQSPTGRYRLTVADDGISLEGPGGSIKLRDTGADLTLDQAVKVKTGTHVTIEAGSAAVLKGTGGATVTSGGVTNVRGATVALNCLGGGKPVARMGDPVQVVTAAPGSTSQGTVLQGSQSVISC